MALCSVCKELPCGPDKRRWGTRIDQRDRDGFEWTIMRYNLPGNFGGLEKRAREGCEGCWFFYDTLREHVYRRWWSGPLPQTVPIDPEKKVHLEGRTGSVTDYELGIENESRRCRLDLRRASDLQSQHDFSPQIPTNPSDDACWGTALGWLETCMTKHTSCIASAIAPVLPKRIIDVLPDNEPTAARLILPAINTTARFVALSHCWGSQDNPMTKLTLDNQTKWQHDGLDVQSLPRNFRDAITITRRLGIRYLWIDALCILQDSTTDWIAQVPKMADIFGTATLVLSATTAKHCDEGILQPRMSTCSPLLGPSQSWFLTRPTPSTFTPNTLDSEINAGYLSSRGWAVQERMVAQRLLHYTPVGMIWECSTHLRSELPWMKPEGNKRWIPALVEASRRNRQDDESDPISIPKSTSSRVWPDFLFPYRSGRKKKKKMANTELDTGVFIKEWIKCITLYSSRNLTFPSDKLAAVAGLAALFHASLPPVGEYLAGTWSGYMATCLGWAKEVAYYHNKLPLLSNQEFRAPSWSWAAGDGRIFWPQEENSSSPRASSRSSAYNYQDSILDARLVDHHMIALDGDGTSHLMGANEGSCIILEANCLHPSDLSSNTAVQCSYDPDWSEYTTGNPLPENPGLEGQFKFVQLRSRFVENKNKKESYFEFWGLHLHRRSGTDSDFRRTGLLTCKIPCQVAMFKRAKAMAAAEEEYRSLPWKRECVKII